MEGSGALQDEEDHLETFRAWLHTFIGSRVKEKTIGEQEEESVLAALKENTLWDIEPYLEWYFGDKIRHFEVEDVQSLISPILHRWKKAKNLESQSKLLSDRSGDSLKNYFHAQEIPSAPGLFLGSRLAAQDLFWLKSTGITHILTAAANFPPLYREDFSYRTLEVWDAEYQTLEIYFRDVSAWIDHALAEGGKVLVHWYV